MPTPDPAELVERVEALEQVTRRLASSMETVKRSHRETRLQVKHLADIVEGIPARVTAEIKTATNSQTEELRTALAQAETANADRITSVARQWPAGAIVLATFLVTVIAGVVLDALLALSHASHLG